MRRKDREITDFNQIVKILQDCTLCRLAFADRGEAYIVPLNFGVEEKDGKLTLYFHGAKEGRKIDLINKLGTAAFQTDTRHILHRREKACDFAYGFKSVIGQGKISIVDHRAEKLHGLAMIMAKYSPDKKYNYDENMLAVTAVFKLEVQTLSCKYHK